MKKSLLLALSLSALSAAEPPLLGLDLEDLSQIPVETSTISNRYELDLDRAAGSVTVVTDEEIARHGYKTLQELLNTVVGFDEAYHIYRSLVSNRGFRQDINSNYLLLIDGHRVNEDTYGGFDMAHIFPLMDNVKRVEIIRGPSSTLWGSSAINGIIAVTTKNGADYAGSSDGAGTVRASIDYEIKNDRTVVNVDYAKTSAQTDWLLSAQFFDSASDWGKVYGYGVADMSVYKKPQAQYDYMPSYRLYGKVVHKDLTLYINHTDYANIPDIIALRYPRQTKDEEAHTKQSWIDLQYAPRISDTVRLETRLFYDNKTLDQQSWYLDGSLFRHQKFIDRGVGTEAILHHNNTSHHLLGGLYAHRKHLEARFNVDGHAKITDKNLAFFAEYSYKGIENWLFTVGGRAEYGSPRGTRRSFLPRASVFWQMDESLFLKCSFNTGSLRPTLLTMRDYYYTSGDTTYFAKGADKSQKSASYDFQVGYKRADWQINATFYYSTIKDLILWGDQYNVGTMGGAPIVLWETNLADLVQKGVEIEWRWFLTPNWTLYGNYAYADTRYDDEWVTYEGRPVLSLVDDLYTDDSLIMAGAPQQTWNFGIDWDVSADKQLNFHYRGRYGVLSIYPNPEWKTFKDEHFFDLNFRWLRPLGDKSEIDFYVKNVTDNRGLFPMGYGQIETALGRQIGGKITIGF